MGKRKLTGFRSSFTVKVTDTHIFHKQDGIDNLVTRTNIGGVYFESTQVSLDEFEIVSRIHARTKHALMDYEFLLHSLERNYGNVTSKTLLGRYTRYKDTWIEFDVIGEDIIARNEWERGMYRVI